MPIRVVCPSCDSKLKAPDALVGRSIDCPKCTYRFKVEVPSSDASEPQTVGSEHARPKPPPLPPPESPLPVRYSSYRHDSPPPRRRDKDPEEEYEATRPAFVSEIMESDAQFGAGLGRGESGLHTVNERDRSPSMFWVIMLLTGAGLLFVNMFLPWWKFQEVPFKSKLRETEAELGREIKKRIDEIRRSNPVFPGGSLSEYAAREQRKQEEIQRAIAPLEAQIEALRRSIDAEQELIHKGRKRYEQWMVERVSPGMVLVGFESLSLWGWNTGAGIMGLVFSLLIVGTILPGLLVRILKPWTWIAGFVSAVLALILLPFSFVWIFGAPGGTFGNYTGGIVAGPYVLLVASLLTFVGGTTYGIVHLRSVLICRKASDPRSVPRSNQQDLPSE